MRSSDYSLSGDIKILCFDVCRMTSDMTMPIADSAVQFYWTRTILAKRLHIRGKSYAARVKGHAASVKVGSGGARRDS